MNIPAQKGESAPGAHTGYVSGARSAVSHPFPESHSATPTGGPRVPRTSHSTEHRQREMPQHRQGPSPGGPHTPHEPAGWGRSIPTGRVGGVCARGTAPGPSLRHSHSGGGGQQAPGRALSASGSQHSASGQAGGSARGCHVLGPPWCCWAEPWALRRLTLAFRGEDSGSREASPREAWGPPNRASRQHPRASGALAPQLPS